MDAKDLTRKGLYELVWQKPVEELAKEFGMSGRGLGKLCERYGIPVPPRGYWAQKAAGQKVAKPPLIEILGTPLSDVGIRFPIPSPTRDDTLSTEAPFKQLWLDQTASIGKVEVPGKLNRPHAIIARWLAADELLKKRSRQDRWSGIAPYASPHEKPVGERRLRILNAILKYLEAIGFIVQEDRERSADFIVRMGSDDVHFRLQEWNREYRRPLTPEEATNQSYRGQKWRQIKEATGLLEFRITSYPPNGVPDRWRETEQTIEEKLPEILGALIATIASDKLKREGRQAAERLRREAEELKRRRAEDRKAEDARKQILRSQAHAWREAANLRDFVTAARSSVLLGSSFISPAKLDQWSTWALAHADEIDPLCIIENADDDEKSS